MELQIKDLRLLKSGEKDRNRWISLDEDYGNRL